MTTFFAIGIVLNVVLTGLALYWLWRQRAPKPGRDETGKSRTDHGQGRHEPGGAPDASNHYLAEHAQLLTSSYRHWTGRDLIDPNLSALEQARALYEAPFVVASHGTEADPVFNYANRAALALFETGWTDFTAMPSRLSAEPMERAQRAELLERVSRQGFIDDYCGVRISATGRRFRIRNATVWNLVDAQDAPAGQAVMFRDWEYL
ncbi:MAG: MEKHLA domain-containing protein [Pseudomonadota bacterium]